MNTTRWAVRFCFVAYGLTFASWASRIPQIKAALHLSDGDLGKILFAMPVGQLVSLQGSGKVASQLGSHRVAPVALAIYALVLLAIGAAREPWQLAVALFFFGLCGNMASVSLQTQGVLTEKQAGRPLLASFHGAWSLAGFAAGLLGTYAISAGLSPGRHFLLVATGLWLCLPVAARGLLAGARPSAGAARPRGFDPTLAALGVIGFCSMGTEGCMFDWSGVYFRDVVHSSPELVAVGYTAFMMTTAAGRFLGDRVVARVGRLRVVQTGGVLMSLGLLASVLCPTFVPATLAFVVVGLGCSNLMPSVYSLTGRARPDDLGNALASVGQISFLGFLIGPPLIGQVAAHFGLRASFAVIACLGLLVPSLATRIRPLLLGDAGSGVAPGSAAHFALEGEAEGAF